MSIEDIANRMYGAATPPQTAPAASPQAPQHQGTRTMDALAEALYGAPSYQQPARQEHFPHRTTEELAASFLEAPHAKPSADNTPAVEQAGQDATAEPEQHDKRTAEQLAADAYQQPAALPAPKDAPSLADIRNDPTWAAYPAAAEAELPREMFDQAIGQSGITAEQAAQATAEMRAVALDLSLSGSELQAVKAGFVRASTAQRDASGIGAAREHAVNRLNTEHGESAALAFRCARAYVTANPRLAAALDATNAGDDPEVVATIARKALALHRAGKLKV